MAQIIFVAMAAGYYFVLKLVVALAFSYYLCS